MGLKGEIEKVRTRAGHVTPLGTRTQVAAPDSSQTPGLTVRRDSERGVS